MELKEFGPLGGRASLAPPLDPPLVFLQRHWLVSPISVPCFHVCVCLGQSHQLTVPHLDQP